MMCRASQASSSVGFNSSITASNGEDSSLDTPSCSDDAGSRCMQEPGGAIVLISSRKRPSMLIASTRVLRCALVELVRFCRVRGSPDLSISMKRDSGLEQGLGLVKEGLARSIGSAGFVFTGNAFEMNRSGDFASSPFVGDSRTHLESYRLSRMSSSFSTGGSHFGYRRFASS